MLAIEYVVVYVVVVFLLTAWHWYSECSSPLASLHNNSTFSSSNLSSGSNSPDSDYYVSNLDNMDNNVAEFMVHADDAFVCICLFEC